MLNGNLVVSGCVDPAYDDCYFCDGKSHKDIIS